MHGLVKVVVGATVAVGLAGCAEVVNEPTRSEVIRPGFVVTDPTPVEGQAMLCKVGTSAGFDVTVDGTTSTYMLNDGECATIATAVVIPGKPTPDILVTVNETLTPGIVLDSITLDSVRFSPPRPAVHKVFTGTTTVTSGIDDDNGITITYYNTPAPPPPPPAGGEGCTPGYWKQSHHFDSWVGYTPNQLFSSVFENAFPGKTLVQVLSSGGGGLDALGRHTVAALLNTANGGVSYDLTTQQVIDAFNATYPGSKNNYNAQKDVFEGFNQQGCPLN